MSHFTLNSIGKRIRTARTERAMTQRDLAKAVGKSKQLISAWESGRTEILSTSLARIGQALSVDVAWLLYGTAPGEVIPSLPEGRIVPFVRSQELLKFVTAQIGVERVERRLFVPTTVSDNAFALAALDDGMRPHAAKDDIMVVDPDVTIEPGMLVLSLVRSQKGRKLKNSAAVIREIRFRTFSSAFDDYQLVASHEAYPVISVKRGADAILAGAVVAIFKLPPFKS